MYVLSQGIKTSTDISSYFDEDFYNSSIIYQLPRITNSEYVMTYRTREDLVSRDLYGDVGYLGLIFLANGPTIDKNSEGDIEILEEYEPLKTVGFKNLEELRSAQLLTVVQNTLTTKEINPVRSPGHEYFILRSKRFQPVTQD